MKAEHYNISAALKRRRKLKRDIEILQAYDQGRESTTDIARRFGLDRCHVLKIVRELRAAGVK